MRSNTTEDPNRSSHQTACHQDPKLHATSELRLQAASPSNSYSNISRCTTGEQSQACGDNTNREDVDLIRLFNTTLGPNESVEPSVAQVILDLCGRDVRAAVAFYMAQQDQEQQQTSQGSSRPPLASSSSTLPSSRRTNLRRVSAQSCRNVTSNAPLVALRPMPRRYNSFDPSPTRTKSFDPFKRTKSFDVAEAPSVTAPSFRPSSNHYRYPTHQRSPRSNKLAPSRGYLGRAKSGHYFFDDRASCAAASKSITTITSSKVTPPPSLRNMRRSITRLEKDDLDSNGSAPVVVTRPPTARASSTRSLGRNLSGRELEKWDPSAKAA